MCESDVWNSLTTAAVVCCTACSTQPTSCSIAVSPSLLPQDILSVFTPVVANEKVHQQTGRLVDQVPDHFFVLDISRILVFCRVYSSPGTFRQVRAWESNGRFEISVLWYEIYAIFYRWRIDSKKWIFGWRWRRSWCVYLCFKLGWTIKLRVSGCSAYQRSNLRPICTHARQTQTKKTQSIPINNRTPQTLQQ